MSAACPLFAVWWSSVLLTGLEFPGLSTSFLTVKLDNASCSRVSIGEGSGTLNSSQLSVKIDQPSNVVCSAGIQLGAASTNITVDLAVHLNEITVGRELDDLCFTTNFIVDRCSLNVKVNDINMVPKFELFEMFKPIAQYIIEEKSETLLCNAHLPLLGNKFVISEVKPEKPAPPPVDGAVVLNTTPVFRGVTNVVNNIPVVFGVRLGAKMHEDTATRTNFTLPNGVNMTLYEDGALSPAISSLLASVEDALKALSLDGLVANISQMIPAVNVTNAVVDIPSSFTMSMDVVVTDVRCSDEAKLNCTIPCSDAVLLQNLRTVGLGDINKVAGNNMEDLLLPHVESLINSVLASNCTAGEERRPLPLLHAAEVRDVPPLSLWLTALCMSVVAFALGICWSIYRHRKDPATLADGSPISQCRALTEDGLLLLLTLSATFLLVWSNSTTAAAVVVGGEFNMLQLSLMEITSKIFKAGHVDLAIGFFFFSGVYPYVKLLCILVCTLGFRKPQHAFVRLLDCTGKFSFIDTFAMVVMVGGLELSGIAEVHIRPGFYCFLFATILTIFVGNYALYLWRRNTSVRLDQKCSPSEPSHSENDVVEAERDDELDTNSSKGKKCDLMRFVLRGLNGAATAVCVLLMWFIPCLRYNVGGLASVVQPDSRDMAMFELTSGSFTILTVCFLTTVLVPFLFAITYPNCSVTASWCAADALSVACIAGLVQLGKFVSYIIGEGMEAIYTAEAKLLWPMYPVFAFVIWQWILVIEREFKPVRWVWQHLTRPRSTLSSDVAADSREPIGEDKRHNRLFGFFFALFSTQFFHGSVKA
ncbi:hypothetical protein, conserved [Trypanosoma brucei brucei TREU927]|uniref:Paraquat-inducible protein A n=1 Tax=Trypanosoma brucei brucei (strain 927/4 GUTat10.1) TaxID=185431 RepID=Q38FZ8_TRYB2|nr:hypothetical protein, conserved [Trypanosoma brucei brucei TREU927]EAN76272.1 hypothetical protein, conserved [Trypanosoma brucei brucei TREU927]